MWNSVKKFVLVLRPDGLVYAYKNKAITINYEEVVDAHLTRRNIPRVTVVSKGQIKRYKVYLRPYESPETIAQSIIEASTRFKANRGPGI